MARRLERLRPLAETFGHQSVAISRTGQPAHGSLPGVHWVASLLKRWLTGTLHYGGSIGQLRYDLDEFTFRFNRRTARSRGLLFYRLLQQAVATDPQPLPRAHHCRQPRPLPLDVGPPPEHRKFGHHRASRVSAGQCP